MRIRICAIYTILCKWILLVETGFSARDQHLLSPFCRLSDPAYDRCMSSIKVFPCHTWSGLVYSFTFNPQSRTCTAVQGGCTSVRARNSFFGEASCVHSCWDCMNMTARLELRRNGTHKVGTDISYYTYNDGLWDRAHLRQTRVRTRKSRPSPIKIRMSSRHFQRALTISTWITQLLHNSSLQN